ncbi:hypothetical protein AURDEDRAFT_158734 [Auricularia subglabra TFB-10046 SS5]|nr:hypothetical protein AURDEDRAFT_158734 [Auricularia subglabra TFB-10046 SS5]
MGPLSGSDSPPTLPPPLLDASPLSASFSYSSPGLPFIISESTPKSLFWKPPADDDASELGVAPGHPGTPTPDPRLVDQPNAPATETKLKPHPSLGPAPCSAAYLQSPYFGLGIAYQPTSARDSYPPTTDVGAAGTYEEEDSTHAASQPTGGLCRIKKLLTPRKGSNASQTSNATSAMSRVLARMSFLSDDTEPAVATPSTVPYHDLDDLLQGSKAERRLSLPASPPPPVAGRWAPRRFSDIAGSPEVLQMSPRRGKGPLTTAVLLRDEEIGHLFQVSPMQTRSMLIASGSASTTGPGTPGPRFDSPVPQRAFMGGNQSASSSKFFEMFEPPPRTCSPAQIQASECATPPAPGTPKCATWQSTLEASTAHASPASPDMRVLRASTSLQEQLLPPRTSLPSHLSIISNMSSRKPSHASSSAGQRTPSLREREINTTARAMFFLGFIAPWCWLIGGWLAHRRLLSSEGSKKYIPKFISRGWGANGGGKSNVKVEMSELPRSQSSTVLYAERIPPSSPRLPSAPHTTPALEYRFRLDEPWESPQYGAPGTYDLELAGLGPHRLDPWVRRCRVAAFVGSAVILAACITAIGIALHVGLER